MGMISDILVNAKSAVQKAHEKANGVCDVSKLKLTRKRIKSDVYKNYTALGRKYYALSKKGEIEYADFTQELEELNDLHEQYENISSQLEELKKKTEAEENDGECDVCPECGKVLK